MQYFFQISLLAGNEDNETCCTKLSYVQLSRFNIIHFGFRIINLSETLLSVSV